ncbi:MAG TPA: A/G-specific adenine glycosylase [Gammaproteobacteria bacterium]|nr:A/G-specific adenine glycosylase [Gammaproteobacteria bacterium]
MPDLITLPQRQITAFQQAILEWFDHHGRTDLPWQQNPTSYRVWISEIMLQQTQVSVVKNYYLNFMQRFPDITTLANAHQDEVLALWSGLGYYSRARNLHKAARIIHDQHRREFPESIEELQALPGIGRSTAGAILSLAQQQRAAILDGNVKRVLARCFAIAGWPGKSSVLTELWSLSEQLTSTVRPRDYNQAMMDLGATLCSRIKPDCRHCPLQHNCKACSQQQQHLYPGKKAAKKLPHRHIQMLLIRDAAGRILLEKRPQTGIWAGLWSLPETAAERQAHAACNQLIGVRPQQMHILEQRRHTFSHFHLHIQPVMLHIAKPAHRVMDSERLVWYKLDQLNSLGIAAPVMRLLKEIGEKTWAAPYIASN